jgi:hypothetical protein
MSQLNYDFQQAIGQAGQLASSRNSDKLTYRATQQIGYGLGLAQGAGSVDVRLPAANVATLSFDGDFIASNEITLDVNGESVGPVVFDTDQATTLEALASAINALENIEASVTDTREITITATDGEVAVDNIVVSGGASQASGSASYSANNIFVGVSILSHAKEQDLDGNVSYEAKDPVSVLTKGRIYVQVEQAVTARSEVYLRHTAGGTGEVPGNFRADDDNGNASKVNARFLSDADAGGIAVLEVNLPQ